MYKKDEAVEAFRQLAIGAGRRGSSRFYRLLAEKLVQLLGMDHALIAVYKHGNKARTLAFWSQKQARANITYSLEGTPSDTISERAPCRYLRHVQTLFPDDEVLETLGAESYVGFPVLASDGSLLGFLAVLANHELTWGEFENDILTLAAAQLGTELERRKTEHALKQSKQLAQENERRLNTLLNHLPGMAYRCQNNRQWNMQLVSQGAKELTGYSAKALLAADKVRFDALIHEEDREHVFTEIQDALRARDSYRVVYRLRHRDGRYRWLWDQGQGVFSPQGQVIYLEGFVCDITDQYESDRVHDAVMQVATTVTSRAGDNYFHELIATLTTLLKADAGFIALLDQPLDLQTTSLQTLSEYLDTATVTTISLALCNRSLPNHTFLLKGTPSEQVVLQQEAVIQKSEAMSLPGTSFHAKACIGRRLDNAQGQAIGVIMVFYRSPLATNTFATSVLRILSTGAAAELERQIDHRRIQYLAYIDTVTGLPNRARFMELFASVCEQGHALSLVLLDIRSFKEINDLHGHSVGDELLATVARRLEAALQPPAIIARLSSNEFAVLIKEEGSKKEGAQALEITAEKLHKAVCQPMGLNNLYLCIEVNIGFACYPDHTDSPSEVFNAANMALHHVKRLPETLYGYRPALRIAIQRRHELTERLQTAITGQGLALYFQPQVNLASGELTGAEALCRWHDERCGWVPAGEFIPLAEERGLIGLLGDWVLGQAARQLSAWELAHTPMAGRLSVNVSAQQFANPRFSEHVSRLTQGVAPQAIGLELTESNFMRNPDQAVVSTQALRQAGYAISIDDFGTGYSSLAYLRRFAVDVLKIDISFVRHMVENQHDRAITQTIIDIANTLGIKPLAEGVESATQAQLLMQMGCQQAQGNWLGAPVDAETFARQWLTARKAG